MADDILFYNHDFLYKNRIPLISKKYKNNISTAKKWQSWSVCLHRIYDQAIQKRDFCALTQNFRPVVM